MPHNKCAKKSDSTFVSPVFGNFSPGHCCRYIANVDVILEKEHNYSFCSFGMEVIFHMKNSGVSRLQQLQFRLQTSEMASHMLFS